MSKLFVLGAGLIILIFGIWFFGSKGQEKTTNALLGFDLIAKKQKKLVGMGSKVKTIQMIGSVEDISTGVRDSKIPSTIPSEFVFPGATVQMVQQLGGRGVTAVLTTSEIKLKVADLLLKKLAESGWKLISGSIYVVADFEKGGQKAQVEVSVEGNVTVISLGLTFPK